MLDKHVFSMPTGFKDKKVIILVYFYGSFEMYKKKRKNFYRGRYFHNASLDHKISLQDRKTLSLKVTLKANKAFSEKNVCDVNPKSVIKIWGFNKKNVFPVCLTDVRSKLEVGNMTKG